MGYQRRVHGGNTSAHMMGRLLVLVALIALSAAVPTKTDVVVPETKFDHRVAFSQMSPTDFIQAMSKAGNSETQCREFATDTIADITATVTGSQATVDAIDTGASCAAEGQDAVAAAQATAATALSTKQSTCTAAVDLPSVNLDALQATTCYDYTTAASYTAANEACDGAIVELADADQAVTVAQTEKSDAATASHEAEWQQAQQIICALDSASTCSVPTCPSVTKPTVAAGVENADAEHCTPEPTTAPTQAPTANPTTAPTRPPASCTIHMAGHARTCYSACDSGRSGSYDGCGTSVYVSGNCRSVTVYDNDNSPDDVNFGAVHGSRYLNLPYDLSSDCAGFYLVPGY